MIAIVVGTIFFTGGVVLLLIYHALNKRAWLKR